ncbi:hypothetical protein RugamoR64_43500 [Duganella rhizosphaerae]|uniref:hypothetical protein n=1 Tax=Duganella rhizosphaerae TaxID=2885763 RepID=UPI0030E99406
MSEQIEAVFIPLATERTKNVIKHLQPGSRTTIDAVSALADTTRIETEIWAVEQDDGVHIYYQDGPSGGAKYLGFADKVRVAIEEAATEK